MPTPPHRLRAGPEEPRHERPSCRDDDERPSSCGAARRLMAPASAASRIHFLGIRAAGVAIALFGGVAASSFLALSALAQWAVSWPDVAGSQPAVRALQLFAFAAGGPAH